MGHVTIITRMATYGPVLGKIFVLKLFLGIETYI